MRTVTAIGLGCALAFGGCAASGVAESDVREASADDVPVRFAYGGLGPSDASFRRVQHPRTGVTVRRASYLGQSEFAVFDLVESLGDSYFTPRPPGAYIEQYLKPGTEVEQGDSGTVPGGRQTRRRAFRLTGGAGAACVELQRSLREHVEGGIGRYTQALLVGVYCRGGGGRIAPEEAARIAAGLSA